MIEKTGFEFGFGKRIESIKLGKVVKKTYRFHSMGITNEVFFSKWFGLKKDSFRLMFYDYDAKVMRFDEFERIIGAFTNDILLFESTKGLHFVSICEDLDADISPETKATNLSKELDQDYYKDISYDYLTLRVIPKRTRNTNRLHKEAPKFVKVIRKPKWNTKCSYEHLKIYTKLGLSREAIRTYLRRCKLCKYKTNYFFYRCLQ